MNWTKNATRGEGRAVLVGSHSDTQTLGGWLDGTLGVAAGLELARAARESGGPRIAVVDFQDEEGRFGGLTGSTYLAGRIARADLDDRTDAEGHRFYDLRQRAASIAEYTEINPDRFSSFFELHIEQGPVLDSAGEGLGIVEAIAGVRMIQFDFEGVANHAGTTPMPFRRDAAQGMIAFATALNAAFEPVVHPETVWTLGRLAIAPNAPSIVPGTAQVTLQIRDPDKALLDSLADLADRVAAQAAASLGLTVDATQRLQLDPVPMASAPTRSLQAAAEMIAPGAWRRMPSGALHDAANVASLMPVGLLFVPSIKGISHNPREDTQRADLRRGLVTLAAAEVWGAMRKRNNL